MCPQLVRPYIPDDQISSGHASPCANAIPGDHYSESLSSLPKLFLASRETSLAHSPVPGLHSSQHGFLRLTPSGSADPGFSS